METIAGLPAAFLQRMQDMLGEEYDAFLQSYEQPRSYGLRRNPLKADKTEFESKMPFSLTGVPWAEEGYFALKEQQPGKHVLHAAGAYYIQEPSAMSVAQVLEVMPGERVCDLCAAPGGKSTQLAGKMQGQGLLIANEIIPSRARILSQNVERMGIRNCVVLNESTDQLASQFPLFFHKMLVDAPCSGEGMFRKDDNASSEWSPEQVEVCAARQREILENADSMLMPGGDLVYSTCTFAPQEDEGVIAWFLREHPAYELVELPVYEGMSRGRADWAREFGTVADLSDEEVQQMHLERSIRLWPHKLSGEGHFVAKLHKKGERTADTYRMVMPEKNKVLTTEWERFAAAVLKASPEGVLVHFGEHLYLVPECMRELKGLKIECCGLHLGQNKKNRFEPSHALALALTQEQVVQSFALTEQQAQEYVRGNAISAGQMGASLSGWVLLTYQGYSIGWGKASGGVIKNHYPKGLRVQGG